MKYIVYLTTNLKSYINGTPRIYVGVHKVYNDPNIFDGYLGCGVWTDKPNTYMYPKTPFQHAVKKYGISAFVRETLYIFDDKESAFNKEGEIVDRDFIKLPHVYNAALGGAISGYSYETLYQFDLQGNLKHTWEVSIEAEEYYGYPREKFFRAWREKSSFLDSFWSKTPSIDISEYKVVGIEKSTYLYDLDGKLVNEFSSQKECVDFLGTDYINTAIKRNSIVKGKYYVSDKLTDLFIPKPRIKCKDLTYHIYDRNGEYYGEFQGKAAMTFVGIHSWRQFDDVINAYNGWRKNFYVSLTKVDSVPEKVITHTTQVDVYDKFGNFIETVDSIKETKIKYNLNTGKLRLLDRKDCYVGNYIFKFHRTK